MGGSTACGERHHLPLTSRSMAKGGRRGQLEAVRAAHHFPVHFAGDARLVHGLVLLEELAWLLEQQDRLTGKLDGAGEVIKKLAAAGSGLKPRWATPAIARALLLPDLRSGCRTVAQRYPTL